MNATKKDSIETLMDDLDHLEKKLSDMQLKFEARRVREAINKLAKVYQFVSDFAPAFKRKEEQK